MSNNTEFIFRGTSLFYPAAAGVSVDLSKFYSSGDFFVPFCVVDKKEIIMQIKIFTMTNYLKFKNLHRLCIWESL